MVALTQSKDILKYGVDAKPSELPMGMSVKGGVVIHKGALVANGAGFVRPARNVASNTDIVLGVAAETIDNSAGADGAKVLSHIVRGVFAFANSSAGEAIAATEIGAVVFAADDQTVSKTSNSAARVAAGKCVGFDGALVLVEVG